MKYTDVIWDFNGTLIDDVEISVEAVNNALMKRGKPLTHREEYVREIEMPLDLYYGKHFDLKEVPMSVLTREFNEYFDENAHRIPLSRGVTEALEALKTAGMHQHIISSFKEEKIRALCEKYGITDYFEKISGADNIKAESKVERGRDFIKGLPKERKAVVIGDLLHDCEMAFAMGADAVLYCGGHQCKETLLTAGVPVADSIEEIVKIILG